MTHTDDFRAEHADPEQGAHACCAPQGLSVGTSARASLPLLSRSTELPRRSARSTTPSDPHRISQAIVPTQTFEMGDSFGDGRWGDGETPVHAVSVSEFSIDTTSVTNDDFHRFVDATGYRTESEVAGYSAVFHLVFAGDDRDVLGRPPQTPWWWGVAAADWRHPGGRHSSIEGLGDHPVVQVSWNDAVAYCEWAGRALPTEAQWEAASRGGLPRARYPWGDDLRADDDTEAVWRVNIWQGTFPTDNTLEDGHLATAPVRSYEPNEYGLWQTVGNVWEWCTDVFAVDTYAKDAARGDVRDPTGPLGAPADAPRVTRGGSFLCHDSYCNRYRNAARSSNTPDSATSNIGFRTVSRPLVARRGA